MAEITAKLIIKKTAVEGAVPDQSFLSFGELALNYRDGILYYKDADGVIQSISSGGAWGTITGTLDNQEDLALALSGKLTQAQLLVLLAQEGDGLGVSSISVNTSGSGQSGVLNMWSDAGFKAQLYAPLSYTADRIITLPDASGTLALTSRLDGAVSYSDLVDVPTAINFVEGLTSAAPNDTVNVSSLTAAATTTNVDAVFRPKGTGSIIAAIPDNLVTGGNKRGVGAIDLQTVRTAASQVASGSRTVIVGGSNNTCVAANGFVGGGSSNLLNTNAGSGVIGGGSGNTNNSNIGVICGGTTNSLSGGYYQFIGGGSSNTINNGDYVTVVGGRSNEASAYYAFVGGGYDNGAAGENSTVSGGYLNTISSGGTYSTIAGGIQNTANGSQAAVLGGQANTASGTYSSVTGGASNTASGQYSSVLGGRSNVASGDYSATMGYYSNTRSIYGMMAHATGRYNTSGDAQHGRYVVSRYVTDTSSYELTGGGSTPSATTRITMPNNSVFVFDGSCAAKAGANVSSWRFRGTIKRGADAASTALVGAVTIDAPLQDAGASTWTFTINADTTNGALRLLATGQVGVSIVFCATVNTTEVIN
jgi:hypothetical protein